MIWTEETYTNKIFFKYVEILEECLHIEYCFSPVVCPRYSELLLVEMRWPRSQPEESSQAATGGVSPLEVN